MSAEITHTLSRTEIFDKTIYHGYFLSTDGRSIEKGRTFYQFNIKEDEHLRFRYAYVLDSDASPNYVRVDGYIRHRQGYPHPSYNVNRGEQFKLMGNAVIKTNDMATHTSKVWDLIIPNALTTRWFTYVQDGVLQHRLINDVTVITIHIQSDVSQHVQVTDEIEVLPTGHSIEELVAKLRKLDTLIRVNDYHPALRNAGLTLYTDGSVHSFKLDGEKGAKWERFACLNDCLIAVDANLKLMKEMIIKNKADVTNKRDVLIQELAAIDEVLQL